MSDLVTLQITAAPSAEPVTLAEVKGNLNLTTTADDAKITRHITTAREFAERVMRRSLALKSYAAFYDSFRPSFPLEVPMPPLISVTAVKYLDNTLMQQTWDPSEYAVQLLKSGHPGVIVPAPTFVFPCAYLIPGAVEVDFTAGYGAESGPVIPGHVAEGIRQLAAHLYEHPEAITSEGLKEVPIALMSFFRVDKVWAF